MRRFFIIVFSLACSLRLSAAQTDSPKGHDPVYISHYGRHGSRYAYTAKAYSVPLDMLREGAAAENLTPYGEQILDQLERFWQKARYQVGDLTPLGWEQHRYIARTMVGTFPSVFNRGSRVDACSSASFRSVLSMSSECLCIAREASKADIYERFREYGPYCTSCVSIVDDIIAKADARLALGERGADLRFGHDHVVMPLLMIMGVNGFGTIPSSADDLIGSFRTFCSPMAANIQLVFYAPKKNRSGDVLVKLLLNGEEARLDGLTPTEGPYYEWNTLRDHLYRRGSLFATR